MIEYIKFWVAKELSGILLFLAIAALILAFIFLVCAIGSVKDKLQSMFKSPKKGERV